MIPPFVLHRPSTLEEAVGLLAQYGEDTKILAGGSELILLFKMDLARPRHVMDIKGIPELSRLEYDVKTQVLRVGGLVTHRTLEGSEVVRQHFPVLAEMERQVANVRVRNVGTLGGNLCFAEPHADPGAILLAYQARIEARGVGGERIIEIADFFLDYYQTALGQNEILTNIEIPKLNENFSGTYLRFCPGERPTVAVALLIEWKDGSCKDVRLVLGCVGPKPIRASEVEEGLKGKSADEVTAKALEAGEEAALLCDPPPDIWGSVEYKIQIVKTLVSRGLQDSCRQGSAHE